MNYETDLNGYNSGVYKVLQNDLNKPGTNEEVTNVCLGVLIDYEHEGFAGPVLWNFLFELYNEFWINLQFVNL